MDETGEPSLGLDLGTAPAAAPYRVLARKYRPQILRPLWMKMSPVRRPKTAGCVGFFWGNMLEVEAG